MLKLEKIYCALAYGLFFALFAIVYAENVPQYAHSQRAFAVSVIALAALVLNAVIIYRTVRYGSNSRLVSMNNVVGAWRMNNLNYSQRRLSAIVNLVSMALFIVIFWIFRRYMAGMVLSVAVLGYEISEIFRPRRERISFWVLSFSVPVFVFLLAFIFLMFFGGLQ